MTDTNNSPEAQVDNDAPEDIAQAKELGWKDPSDWKGKPPAKGFMTAREWVEHSQKVLPLVEKQLKKASERADKVANELEAYKRTTADTVAGLERMSKAALAEQRRQIEREYAAEKEKAVEVGDTVKYRALVKEEKADLDELKKSSEPSEEERKAKATEPAKLPAEAMRVIDTWKADNSDWYGKNRAMSLFAESEHARLVHELPGLSLEKNLEKVLEAVKEEFPHKFKVADDGDEDESPRRGSAVEGGSRINGGGGARSLYAKLPPEAKKQADIFIKEDGLFLEKGEKANNPQHLHAARERYAQSYEEQNR